MKSWLQDSNIDMHSTHSEGKSVAAERFLKNVYIDKLDDIIKWIQQ